MTVTNRTRARRRGPHPVAGLLLLPLLLSGCFVDPGEGGPGEGERIALAMLLPPRSGLSPFSDDAFKLSRWSTAETLVVLDELGEPLSALATGWEREDELTWRFTLRPGVDFHDGTEMGPEQVVASLVAATEASPVPRILDGVGLSVRRDGEDVLVATADPDPLLPQRLSSPQLSVLAPAAYGEDGVVDPVGTGTGPFELVGVEGTVGATLDRFEGYWGEPAAAAGLDVSFVPDGTARAAALRTGEAHVVEAIPVGQVAQLDPERVHEVPMPRTNTLYLNNDAGPFADPGVRAAAREAVDRAALVALAYEGRADVAEGLLGPALPWAAAEREAADYAETLATRAEPSPVAGVEISLGTFTDRAELPEVASLLEQQLEAAGFVVTQDVREYQFIEADALAGEFDAFVLSRATVLDSGDPVAYLFSDFACEGSFNIAQLCEGDVDQALALASGLETGPERRAAVAAVEARLLAEDVVVPLLHERVIQGEVDVREVARDPRERRLITPDSEVVAP